MPTYVYRCRDCGRQFEHFEKMSSKTKSRKCPACGGRSERQISGGAGFLFKGEGFYITDYRSAAYKSEEKAEAGKADSAKPESAKAEPAAAGTSTPGPEAVADKTAAKPGGVPGRRGGAKKKKGR
jgi:putative FmdB family regulatory protein